MYIYSIVHIYIYTPIMYWVIIYISPVGTDNIRSQYLVGKIKILRCYETPKYEGQSRLFNTI